MATYPFKIVFLTGAGISAPSGIPTYRDSDGLWQDKATQHLASAEALYYDTASFLDFFNKQRMLVSQAQSNEAHRMIAELEHCYPVTVITQNIDDLHERAGSTNVIHVHGELTKVCSSENRCDEDCIEEFPLSEPIKLGQKAKDGSQLRPSVVLFGEYVDTSKAKRPLQEADILVIVGTSLKVFPAASLWRECHHLIPKFHINPSPSDNPEFINIAEDAIKGLKIFKKELFKL